MANYNLWTDVNCYNASNFSVISEANLDTFVFSAGIYNIPARWTVTSGVSINLRGNGLVTIGLAASDTYVLQISGGAGETVELNGINIDSTNATIAGVNFANRGAAYSIISENLGFVIGGNAAAVFAFRQGDATFNNLILAGTYLGTTIINSTALTEGGNSNIVFNDPVLSVLSARAGPSTMLSLSKDSISNSVLSVTINNIQGFFDARPGGALGTAIAFDIFGADSVLVDGGDFTVYSDSTNGSEGVLVRGGNATNLQTVNPIVRNLTVHEEFYAGTGIDIGTDDTVDFVVNPQTYDNEVIGGVTPPNSGVTPHGIVHRGMSDGAMYSNRLSRLHSPTMMSTCTNANARSHSNYIFDCYGPCLSAKGNSGATTFNSTVVIAPLSFSTVDFVPKGMFAREQAATINTNIAYINNNIIVLGYAGTRQFVQVGLNPADAATFISNNFYSDTPLPAAAWDYQGAQYGTLAAWNAGEGNSATDKPNFTSSAAALIAAFGNGDVTPLPSTIGGGIKVTGNGPRVPGINGEPLTALN